jgi:hypothetical protein
MQVNHKTDEAGSIWCGVVVVTVTAATASMHMHASQGLQKT